MEAFSSMLLAQSPLSTDAGIIAGIFAIVMALIEVIKVLIAKMIKAWGSPNSILNDDEKLALSEIPNMAKHLKELSTNTSKCMAMHEKYDSNGMPLWYMPRSISESQEETSKILQQAVNSLERIPEAINRLERAIERLDRRIEKLEDKN